MVMRKRHFLLAAFPLRLFSLFDFFFCILHFSSILSQKEEEEEEVSILLLRAFPSRAFPASGVAEA